MKNVFFSLLLILSVNAAHADSETAQKLQGTWIAGDVETMMLQSKVAIKGDQLTWTLSMGQCMKETEEGNCLYGVTHHFVNIGTFTIIGDAPNAPGAKIMQVKFHGIGNPFFGPLTEQNGDSEDIAKIVENAVEKDFELDVLLRLDANDTILAFGSLETTLEDASDKSHIDSDFAYLKQP